MSWKIDSDSNSASLETNLLEIEIYEIGSKEFEYNWWFNGTPMPGALLWGCNPKTLKQAICETKRGLKELSSTLCSVSKK